MGIKSSSTSLPASWAALFFATSKLDLVPEPVHAKTSHISTLRPSDHGSNKYLKNFLKLAVCLPTDVFPWYNMWICTSFSTLEIFRK